LRRRFCGAGGIVDVWDGDLLEMSKKVDRVGKVLSTQILIVIEVVISSRGTLAGLVKTLLRPQSCLCPVSVIVSKFLMVSSTIVHLITLLPLLTTILLTKGTID
jgi:hypothetical protein